MAKLISTAAGPYRATWKGPGMSAAAAIGTIEGMWRLQAGMKAKDIKGHQFGESVVDSIFLGGDVYFVFRFKEWTQTTLNLLWPWDQTGGVSNWGVTGEVARCFTDLAGELVLMAFTGTPAYTAGPRTITFPKACYAPQHNSEVSFGPDERIVPIVMRIYPALNTDVTSTSLKYFETTQPTGP